MSEVLETASVRLVSEGGDRLVLTGTDKRYAEPFVACLDRSSGRTLWKKPLGEHGPRYNAVFATRVQGNRLLVFHDGGIDAYDLEHPPARTWQASFKYQLYTRPAMAEQFAYAPGRLGGLQKFDLQTGRMVQELKCSRADCAATLAGDQLFTLEFSGLLTAWSLAGKASVVTPAAGRWSWPGVPPEDLADKSEDGSAAGQTLLSRGLRVGLIAAAVLIVLLAIRRRGHR